MAVLILIFWGTAMLFSIVGTPCYIPTIEAFYIIHYIPIETESVQGL